MEGLAGFLLAACFLVLGTANALSFPDKYHGGLQGEMGLHPTSVGQSSQSPFHLPLLCDLFETESSSENETDDSSDDEQKYQGLEFEAREYLAYRNSKSTSSRFLSSLQNRKCVSLFVLHHSWKSFLA